MVVVVSDEILRADEVDLINELFNEGLEIFHLRKPLASVSEVQILLKGINKNYYGRIALHHHHQLADRFSVKRLHFAEESRKKTNESELAGLKEHGFHLSTSIHKLEEIDTISNQFEYTFFGPVFDSISKKGHTAVVTENFKIQVKGIKLFAIGGIDRNNVSKAFEMGFSGVGVLGAVWQSADPVKSFKQIKKAWDQIVR